MIHTLLVYHYKATLIYLTKIILYFIYY